MACETARMTDQSANLQLTYLAQGQAQKHVSVNESLLRLDALVQMAAESASASVQPAAPADGALYIVPEGKSGAAWSAMANGALALSRLRLGRDRAEARLARLRQRRHDAHVFRW